LSTLVYTLSKKNHLIKSILHQTVVFNRPYWNWVPIFLPLPLQSIHNLCTWKGTYLSFQGHKTERFFIGSNFIASAMPKILYW
jgi:hypothetical protein